MSIVSELVRHILETPFENFDPSTVNSAKERIIDVIGCLNAGANASGCGLVKDLLKEWGGKKESTI